jgi:hypothetical protein
MKYVECLAINNTTHKVELIELTQTMAENLSEIATVVSVEALGGKTTVWRNRVPSVIAVDGGAIAELMRRAVWRDNHAGMLS